MAACALPQIQMQIQLAIHLQIHSHIHIQLHTQLQLQIQLQIQIQIWQTAGNSWQLVLRHGLDSRYNRSHSRMQSAVCPAPPFAVSLSLFPFSLSFSCHLSLCGLSCKQPLVFAFVSRCVCDKLELNDKRRHTVARNRALPTPTPTLTLTLTWTSIK